MTYEDAKFICHVRSSIYRTSNPKVKYNKNHPVSFDDRVPDAEKDATDWQEYDPRESSYEAMA